MLIKFNGYNFAGNVSSPAMENKIDYYAPYAWPDFATICKGTDDFLLHIKTVDDERLEDHELLRVIAIPPHLPEGHIRCTADLIIHDDDGKIIYVNLLP